MIGGSLAGLLDSGVPLIQGLETAANVCGNEVLGSAARDAATNVVLGRRLSDELEKSQHPHIREFLAMDRVEIG